MRLIPLTQNKFAMVDDSDFKWLNSFKWYYNEGYAVRSIFLDCGKRTTVRMHQFILNTPEGMETDHEDDNKLNNQRYNIRICTHSQNQMNKSACRKHTSRYKGVCWDKNNSKWYAQIKIKDNRMFLGRFKDEKEAATAYNKTAQKHFGDWARLNEI